MLASGKKVPNKGRRALPLLHYFSTISKWSVLKVHYLEIRRENKGPDRCPLLHYFSIITLFCYFRYFSVPIPIKYRPTSIRNNRNKTMSTFFSFHGSEFFREKIETDAGKVRSRWPPFRFPVNIDAVVRWGLILTKDEYRRKLIKRTPRTNIVTRERKGFIIG